MRSHLGMTLLLALIGVLFAGSCWAKDAAAFCKCICGDDSQIIALNPIGESDGSNSGVSDDGLMRRLASTPFAPLLEMSGMRRRADEDESDKVDDPKDSTKRGKTCADCTRQFCLDYNLPKCKTLPAEKVMTDCFKRDSSKDQAVVLIFIAATASLLLWAVLRPWVQRVMDNARERSSYRPVAEGGR